MKTQIRKSVFETNSSSTHSLVITDANDLLQNLGIDPDGSVVIGRDGTIEFGWEQEDYNDPHSKVNYAYFQSESRDEWRSLLEEVVLEHTGAERIKYDFPKTQWGPEGYIDHQSLGGDCAEMFDSKETLKRFLFSPKSYVITDNDNH